MSHSNEIASCLFCIENIITDEFYSSKSDILEESEYLRKITGQYFSFLSSDEFENLRNIIQLCLSYYKSYGDDELDLDSAILFCENRKLLVNSINSMFSKLSNQSQEKSEIPNLYYQLSNGYFPDDVTQIINLTYEEIVKNYTNQCFISAISLCGKVLETCLSSLYIKVFDKNPDDEKLGFDATLNRLKKSGYEFHDGTINQMKVISAHRNKAIHGTIIVPTRDEARGVIYLTKDVMTKSTSK